jgi:hypothetical protein
MWEKQEHSLLVLWMTFDMSCDTNTQSAISAKPKTSASMQVCHLFEIDCQR